MEKDSNIVMDWNTYAVVANCYFKKKLIDKANDTLKKAEKLVAKDGVVYNHLISLHARLGNKEDVLRLWGLQKTALSSREDFVYLSYLIVDLSGTRCPVVDLILLGG
nr:hypothetical protein [Tanacetum cinerariifolium]